jgi:ferritin-like metal-binding protein YciE
LAVAIANPSRITITSSTITGASKKYIWEFAAIAKYANANAARIGRSRAVSVFARELNCEKRTSSAVTNIEAAKPMPR